MRVVEESRRERANGAPWMNAPGNVPLELLPDGSCRALKPVSGDVFVAWQSDSNPGCMLRENQRHPEKITKTRR